MWQAFLMGGPEDGRVLNFHDEVWEIRTPGLAHNNWATIRAEEDDPFPVMKQGVYKLAGRDFERLRLFYEWVGYQ